MDIFMNYRFEKVEIIFFSTGSCYFSCHVLFHQRYCWKQASWFSTQSIRPPRFHHSLTALFADTIPLEIHWQDHNQSTYRQGHEQAIRHYHYSEQTYHQKRCTCRDCGQAGTDERYCSCPRQARKSLHNVLSAAGDFGNKIDIVDIQNPGNFHESIFFGNTITGFILCYANISVPFFISSFKPNSRCVNPRNVRILLIRSPSIIILCPFWKIIWIATNIQRGRPT